MKSRQQPIKIMGGGLAGLTAAITLKNNGYNPIVYEKQSVCGASRHGDYEGLETWNFCPDPQSFLIQIGINPAFNIKRINTFKVHFDEFESIEITDANPFFHLVKRGSNTGCIDREFQIQAIKNDIDIRFGEKSDKGSMDIISAGAQKANAYILGYTFKTDLTDQIHLFMNTSITKTGYGYLIIHNHQATLAAAFKKDDMAKKTISDNLIKTANSVIGFIPDQSEEFASFGSFNINQTRNDRKNRLFIGEAGGFQDYLFGFGMNHAIHSGYYAAKSIIEKKPFKTYFERKLLPHMKASSVNRYFYEQLNEKQRYNICKKISQSKSPLQYLIKHSRYTFKKKMIYTLFSCKF